MQAKCNHFLECHQIILSTNAKLTKQKKKMPVYISVNSEICTRASILDLTLYLYSNHQKRFITIFLMNLIELQREVAY